jgi:hypothetical protein
MTRPTESRDRAKRSRNGAPSARRFLRSVSAWLVYIVIGVLSFLVVIVLMNVAQDLL